MRTKRGWKIRQLAQADGAGTKTADVDHHCNGWPPVAGFAWNRRLSTPAVGGTL